MSEYKEIFKRKEVKYLIDERQYEEMMRILSDMAKVDEYGLSKINNIYYDTKDMRLVRTSMEKPLYKEKLRLRTYGDTDDDTNAFMEIKKKYKGIVYKRRTALAYKPAYDFLKYGKGQVEDSQVVREIRAFLATYEDLRPAMVISYDRTALAGIYDPDFRVTFDSNIRWRAKDIDIRSGSYGKALLKGGEYLMEIKVKDALPGMLASEMSRLGIFPVSFSKYGKGYEDMITAVNDQRIKEETEKCTNIYFHRSFQMAALQA